MKIQLSKPHRYITFQVRVNLFSIILIFVGTHTTFSQNTVNPAKMAHITTIDKRFQSYNVEMAEVIGGNFWKPYDSKKEAKSQTPTNTDGIKDEDLLKSSAMASMFEALEPIDLYNTRLRKLATALGPTYMRVSGTWANKVYFQDDDNAAMTKAPKGYDGILTHKEWKGVVDFSKAADTKIITSFAISEGVRDEKGVWTAVQAKKIADYTKKIGGEIVAAELFNEPSFPVVGGGPAGYKAENFAKDFAVFKAFSSKELPNMQIVGPGSAGEGIELMAGAKMPAIIPSEAFLKATPQPKFDVFSYHYYGAVSQRCAAMGLSTGTSAEVALSEAWLAQTDQVFDFYKPLIDKFTPNKQIWITETADAACGGNPWSVTFIDCFRYLDQMGRLAKKGVDVIYHNTLVASEYGMIDQHTFVPRPRYWAAFVWNKLMGTKVLESGIPIQEGLHVYAHNLKGKSGGVCLMVINNDKKSAKTLHIPIASERYTLSADELQGRQIKLNGKVLETNSIGDLPTIGGVAIVAGEVLFAPGTITFLAMPKAGNNNCK